MAGPARSNAPSRTHASAPGRAGTHAAPLLSGTVIAAFGRQYQVAPDRGEPLLCFPRGKKSEIACGDRVQVEQTAPGQGVIEAVAPRDSLLYRSNEFRQKLIAANVTQIAIVVATEPSFYDDLVTRCLVAAEDQEIRVLIVLNKCDLAPRLAEARARLAPLVKLGYTVIELSALEGAGLDELRAHLAGQVTVLVGQSGMGKSTLTNALIPEAQAATREISAALDSGKHTTTHARLYPLPGDTAGGALIDSPGLQDFGLHHLDQGALEYAFPEFRALLGQCRFRNCQHDQEPGCAFQAALAAGELDPRRFATFRQLLASANA